MVTDQAAKAALGDLFSPQFKKIKIASTLKNQGLFDFRKDSAGGFSRRGSTIEGMSGRGSMGAVGSHRGSSVGASILGLETQSNQGYN